MQDSISSGVLGIPKLKSSHPFSVIKTTSSILTPDTSS
jgi:hypothetical protein